MFDEFGNRFRNARNLFGTQLWKHGEREHFLCGVLRVRKITGLWPSEA